MNIDPKSEIAGFPALQVRALIRKIGEYMISPDYASRHFGISIERAEKTIKLLVEEGFLRRAKFPRHEIHYEATQKGRRLALASAAKPITRKTADRILAEFLDRVKNINADSYFLYKVGKVKVFGSYLSGGEKISDIDIFVELQPKYDAEEQCEREEKRRKEADAAGKQISTFVDRLGWPMLEVLKKLKNRSRAISLHCGDRIIDRVECKTVFEG